jgi:hypothetical protein
MIKIINKLSKYWDKFKNVAKNTVLPALGKIGDIMDSDVVNGITSLAFPALNTVVPGLGAGLSTAKNFISGVGKRAKSLSKQWEADPNNFLNNQLNQFVGQRVPKGIQYARRPDQLHPRIELKSLPEPENGQSFQSYVEEID